MKRAALALALTACGGTPARQAPPAEPLPESPAGVPRAVIAAELDTIIALSDRACACADESCLATVDADVGTYMRRATMNDPITRVETWPADLDALSHALTNRLLACMFEQKHLPTSLGVVVVRGHEALRDIACACTDAPCAGRVVTAFDKAEKQRGEMGIPLDEATTAALDALADEVRACVARPLAEQAILDLKAFRSEACACEEPACADDIAARFLAWAQETIIGTHDQATQQQTNELAAEIRDCVTAARAP